MRVFDFNSAIVRLPGKSVVDGLRAHAGASPTHAAVLAEHAAYVNALRAAGVQVQVLPALDDFPIPSSLKIPHGVQ
jgi:dimethylargininase